MQPITAFTLRVSDTEAITQPLFFNQQDTGVSIAGVQIEAQYRCQLPNGAQGYLLLTSYDCPFEESTECSLLDASFKLVASRSLSQSYHSFLLYAHWPVADNGLRLHYYDQLVWDLHILPSRLARFGVPRLEFNPVATPECDPRTASSMAELSQRLANIETDR
ncbi:hypothetical protein [Shewanella xiamenensis]|uniref:hypothetical protein n=1 Tax=Shewanella xiamenensis TaxID=332186 RepID=UPI001186C828|nr:hypothetical protein [Shewanella xiamenensis]TVL30155.1 hypothetical protein AYI95_13730 [Shewanella xiamenensis]